MKICDNCYYSIDEGDSVGYTWCGKCIKRKSVKRDDSCGSFKDKLTENLFEKAFNTLADEFSE
jgi:hypothetical protein